MSSLTTPTSGGRGPPVPLNTHSVDKIANAFSCCGLPSPPQSASDRLSSRRPSTLGDTCYTQASYACSQPTTPEKLHRAQPNGYYDGNAGHASSAAEMQGVVVAQMPDHQMQDNLSSQPGYDFSLGAYATRHPFANGYAAHAPNIGSTMLSMPPSLHSEPEMSDAQWSNHVASSLDSSAVGYQQYSNASHSFYEESPQVIIPSQVSPHDAYANQQYQQYPNLGHDPSDQSSFTSSISGLDSFEFVQEPSPHEDYFDRTDEKDDYMVVKSEPGRRRSTSQYTPTRHRNRRSRQAARPAVWSYSEDLKAHIRCEATRYPDGTSQMAHGIPYYSVETHSARKPNVCLQVLANGKECGRRFDRPEHLKRHALSHTNERPYTCPLEKCNMAIQRSDNATDHFKTHLKGRTHGQRNVQVEWPELMRGIWESYTDQKRAKTLIDRLDTWVKAGMPPPPGSKRAHGKGAPSVGRGAAGSVAGSARSWPM